MSQSFGQPFMSTMKFSGLMSLQIMEWLQKCSRMSTMQAAQNWQSSVERSPISLMTSKSSSPLTNYTREQRLRESLKVLYSSCMQEELSSFKSFFYCTMQLSTKSSSIFCLLQHLNAQTPLSLRCWTRSTGPKTPSRSSLITTNSPMFWKVLALVFCCKCCFQTTSLSFLASTMSMWPPMMRLNPAADISAKTPSHSITIQSSTVFNLFSCRKSSPQNWDLVVMGLEFLDFLRAPSMTTITFWWVLFSEDFFITTLPDLQQLIFIQSMISQICGFRSFEKQGCFPKLHLMKLRNVTSKMRSPRILARVYLPRTRHTTSSQAFAVICRMVLQYRACSPKDSPFSIFLISLVPFQREAEPSLIMQKDEPGSPSITMVWSLANLCTIRAAVMVSLSWLERQLKNLTFSMNFLFSSYSRVMISSTALLKVSLSIPHMEQFQPAFTETDLGALYRSASSPKPSPTLSCFLTLSLLITCTMPFSIMKKHSALSPSLKRYWSAGTVQKNIFLATLASSASDKLQKMKWFLRQPRMKDISWYFFSLLSRWTSSQYSFLSQSLSELLSELSNLMSSSCCQIIIYYGIWWNVQGLSGASQHHQVLPTVELLLGVERSHHGPLVVHLACDGYPRAFGRNDVHKFNKCLPDCGYRVPASGVGPRDHHLVHRTVLRTLLLQIRLQVLVSLLVKQVLWREHVKELHNPARGLALWVVVQSPLDERILNVLVGDQERARVVSWLRRYLLAPYSDSRAWGVSHGRIPTTSQSSLLTLESPVGNGKVVQCQNCLIRALGILILQEPIALRYPVLLNQGDVFEFPECLADLLDLLVSEVVGQPSDVDPLSWPRDCQLLALLPILLLEKHLGPHHFERGRAVDVCKGVVLAEEVFDPLLGQFQDGEGPVLVQLHILDRRRVGILGVGSADQGVEVPQQLLDRDFEGQVGADQLEWVVLDLCIPLSLFGQE